MNNIFHSLVALITPTNDDNEYEFSSSQGKAKNLPISFQHSMLFGAKFWILSGLKEDSVRWVHFNCSLICTFLIIIFSPVSRISDASYHPRRPPHFPLHTAFSSFSSSFSPLSVHVHLFPFATLVEKQDFTTVNSLLSFLQILSHGNFTQIAVLSALDSPFLQLYRLLNNWRDFSSWKL